MIIKNRFWDSSPIRHALNIAENFAADASTIEQKSWVIDQMVRALTASPMIIDTITTMKFETIEIEMLGKSREYERLASIPGWDKGIPP